MYGNNGIDCTGVAHSSSAPITVLPAQPDQVDKYAKSLYCSQQSDLNHASHAIQGGQVLEGADLLLGLIFAFAFQGWVRVIGIIMVVIGIAVGGYIFFSNLAAIGH